MARLGSIESPVVQRVGAGVASGVLHAGLFLIALFSGDRHDGIHSGDTPTTRLLMLEAREAPERDGLKLPAIEPTRAMPEVQEPDLAQIDANAIPLAALPSFDASTVPLERPPQVETRLELVQTEVERAPETVPISQAEQAALAQQVAKLATGALASAPKRIAWEQDGKQYEAVLVLQRASDGTALDHVVADVSASEHGKKLTTRLLLKRLPFSQFTHMVDRWDPMVQFHDDEIVGRVHSNTPFNLMYDSRTAPRFLGKVTTAARSFHTDSSGRRREADIFQGGVETRAARIPLPDELEPFEWAPRDEDAHVQEFAEDASVQFFADGSYAWEHLATQARGRIDASPERSIYLIARPGVTLHVQGTVAGRVLVYSPHRIEITSSLLYAHDPRSADSPDYLGLVSDKYIAIAPASVTGPGDLEIQAAIFAGRRFVITNRTHRQMGTLRIYGSLSVGSMSASEPRYATRIEYDRRFESQRPPGFPSTNRFELARWDGEWQEVSPGIEEKADLVVREGSD